MYSTEYTVDDCSPAFPHHQPLPEGLVHMPKRMSDEALQLRFDDGHQQRYFSNRRDLLESVLWFSRQSPDPRFEVWEEGEPVLLADGRKAGKRFELREVLDLRKDGVRDSIQAEFESLSK